MSIGIRERWKSKAGYGQLLKVAFPMIISSGSISVLLFIDRMLLSWASNDYIAAVLPAGILNWALLSPFFGTVLYTSTFVAQYTGAKRPHRVGAALWQGLYVAAIGALAMPLYAFFADDIFAFIGHEPHIQELESTYFSIVVSCAGFFLANTVFSCFYSGRGKAWTIVWVNIALTVLNAILDYILIFGHFGFPEMGIKGAGIATAISVASVSALYICLVCSEKNNARFATRTAWRFDKDLFTRLLRFGFPSGVHFFLDIIGITIFMLLVGRVGVTEGAANNITHQIHLLGLLPLIGLGIANGILVGQFQGAGRSDLAERTTYSALHLAIAYNLVVACGYLLLPELLAAPFFLGRDTVPDEGLVELITLLLKFVALFTLFESFVILTSGTLKGAGDTPFVMKVLAFTSLLVVILPTYAVLEIYKLPLTYAWGILAVNLLIVGAVFFARFRSGRWKTHRVIED